MNSQGVGRRNPPGRPTTHGARRFARRYLEGATDGRERETQLLKRELADLVADRGGPDHMSNAELLIAERCAFKAVLCQLVEAYVLRQPSPIANGELLPVLGQQYLAWSNALRLDLQALGLRPERRERVASLAEYLDQRAASEAPGCPPGDERGPGRAEMSTAATPGRSGSIADDEDRP